MTFCDKSVMKINKKLTPLCVGTLSGKGCEAIDRMARGFNSLRLDLLQVLPIQRR
jgi:hypothetical protein